jgi:actin-related protein
MNSSIYRFTLDMQSTQSQVSIPTMLGDTSRKLYINLTDGGNPYKIVDGCLAKLSIKRPTGTHLEAFCSIENNTTIVYDFSQHKDTAIVAGIHDCDVSLYGLDGKVITTAKFMMVVSQRVIADADVTLSDSDFTAVQAMLEEEAKRKAEEEKRVSAETERNSAEEERIASEEARATAEAERATAEAERATAEAERATAEAERATAEAERITAEAIRKEAEDVRILKDVQRDASIQNSLDTSARAEANATEALDKANRATEDVSEFREEIGSEALATGKETVKASVNYAVSTANAAKNQSDTVRTNLINLSAQVQGIGRSYVVPDFLYFIDFLKSRKSVELKEDRNGDGVDEEYNVYVSDLKIGDNIIIVEKGVPDFWFEKNHAISTFDTYTYNGTEHTLSATAGGNTIGGAHILETDYTVIEGFSLSASASAQEAKGYAERAEEASASAENSETSSINSATEAQTARIEAQTARIEAQTARDEARYLVNSTKDECSDITDGHFWSIPYSFYTNGNYYQEIDGVISVRGQRKSSGIIPAPKNLCLDFGINSTLSCFLYFYNKNENGELEVTFDLFKHLLSSGILNYVTASSLESRMIANIPDGTYMEICIGDSTDLVAMYGWDGAPFGMDVCATCSIPVTSSGGTETWLYAEGGSGITVHGKAKHIISNGATMRLVHGFKNGERTQVSGTNKSYLKLPDGYDYFRIRIELTAEGDKKKTLSGNVRDLFYIVAKETEEFPISNAVKVIENSDRICSLTWVPSKNFYVGTQGDSPAFKGNVEYNGLLYSGDWEKAHFVGWHVSPHTFINAMNDVASIAYVETAGEGNKKQPYYGVVCSAFATMCDGWDHPQTNAGFFYDPEIEKYYSHKPQLGQIYTDVTSHCVIPCGITQIGNDSIISAYEAIRPISAKTTRFMSIRYEDIWEWWNGAAGSDYYNNYGYVIHNPKAKADMSLVPYADFENATIIEVDARPYKGDKSVYTSTEKSVKINIKNANANKLYLESESGNVQEIDIGGKSVVDVWSDELEDGIYYVYTDTDLVKESFDEKSKGSFEYVTVKSISYQITGDVLTFSDNDFWYADCHCAGIHYYQNGEDDNGNPTYEKRNVSVLANAKGNYAKWFTNGNRITEVNAIFKKARYGAYTVPIE